MLKTAMLAAAFLTGGVFLSSQPAIAKTTDTVTIAEIGPDSGDAHPREIMPTVSDFWVDYPDAPRLTGRSTTIVAVYLDEHGSLTKSTVLESCGNRFLDTLATYGVRYARFTAGTIDGTAVSGEYAVRIDFGEDIGR